MLCAIPVVFLLRKIADLRPGV